MVCERLPGRLFNKKVFLRYSRLVQSLILAVIFSAKNNKKPELRKYGNQQLG